jgi:DNA-directed RNA polymerase
MKQAIEPTAEAIREFVERVSSGGAGRRPDALKLLSLATPEQIAYLTARIVVNAAATEPSVQRVAFEIAAAIIDHAEMAALKGTNRPGYDGLVGKAKSGKQSSKMREARKDIMRKEDVRIEFSKVQQLHGGMKAIELLVETTGLFTMELEPGRKGSSYKIRPAEAVQTWLERQHARCEILEPIHLPMVVRPKRWRSPFTGGYLTKRPGLRMVKQWNSAYHEELRSNPMPEVYAAINAIQETPWRINRRVLDVMREVWDGGGSLGGLPRREDELVPAKPVDFDTDEDAKKRWKAEAAQTHQRNARSMSSRLALQQRLWIAQKFADEERIYFPHELDFRGRVYPIPSGGPHPQGDDAAKALIEFADGKALGPGGGGWLAVHLANLFGVDKVSFEDRLDWVIANQDAILDSGRDPLGGGRFWTTADSPYCALAACMEWAGYADEGEDWVSHIPIALDGSNSGLQHFSAMLRDPTGARAVNLLPIDQPEDIYSRVAEKAQAIAAATPFIMSGDRLREVPNPWAGGKVIRKITKRPCMTYCYSATRFGMQDMILLSLRELDKENQEAGLPPHLEGADNYHAASWLSHVLWEVISETVSAASSAMEWLRTAARIASLSDKPIWWTAPSGFPVLQAYRTVRGKIVGIHYNGQPMQLTLAVDDERINRRAQANGIAPNFVHSLDAAHLMAVINDLHGYGLEHFAVIHDSFGVHAADAGLLAQVLRASFVRQYQPNVLEEFRDELVAQLPEALAKTLPPIPPLGDLDLSQVLEAEYLFA